ncbi:Glutathione transport system permease protein GsiC [Oceanobacillus picturae]|jgi:peptide/nickel transport system permease protein|uniref:Glutathione transport system permease protein GsiC n=3 Tax=Oceanobacillus picturae TaxID=171693 RepID=W9ANI4_9BACI|nr:ABC transporter permease [Oceanobacillus picturae]RIU91276.1 ABC transporter permease [Oceanobacillus picturae]CDO04181.1 Glutathione transport system permease protein GsiC [Oceanobacillus picturae]
MHKYIIRRILVFIPMLIMLSIIVFALAKAAPGDPFTGKILDPTVDPEVFNEQREALGLNDPIPVQYFRWATSMARGDFGESMYYKGRDVQSLISERIVNTVYLGLFALVITLVVAIPIGIYSAKNPYSPLDYSATTFGFLGLAIPNFFFGLIAIYVFAIKLGWFPAQGTISNLHITGFSEFLNRIHHMVLPGITLGLAGTATYMRYMRSEVLDVLGSDYIRTAKAKGMNDRNVLYKHTLRNAIIPIITLMGFEFGALLSGAIITEQVFSYPGLGTLFINSITNRDYPVIMSITLLLGVAILIGNLLADIFYSIVDPRIRYD